MKKVLVVACLSVFVLASCKKDYTCECTFLGEKDSIVYKDIKKKDAKDKCEKEGAVLTIFGGSCEIK